MTFDTKQLKEMSNAVRAGALYAIRSAASGHIGIVLGASDIITVLYANYIRPGVDEFVLSAGHGSAMLYSVLKLAGYKIPALKTFRKFKGLGGHPEIGTNGVTATTGPLGQGIANAIGMAFAKKIKGARHAKGYTGYIYCMCSDGDLMEGVTAEAMGFAGRYKLDNLVVLWDDNQISIDGVAQSDINIPARIKALGWAVLKANGNDFADIKSAIDASHKLSKPVFIQCSTQIGAGSSVAGTHDAHALGISLDEMLVLEEKLTSARGMALWEKMAKRKIPMVATKAPKEIIIPIPKIIDDNVATRTLSGKVIEEVLKIDSNLIGGSADLATSTNTKTPLHSDITTNDFSGNFINYGVREHAMAAIMNGMCASGIRVYGGTFLAFSDYMRPSIRLSAISKLPVIYVFSHDSIAVGEDGPTHQPVEQLAGLRLIPNMNVFRPCNITEVAKCWEIALNETDRPSCIILSRQKIAQIKTPYPTDVYKGGYIIKPATDKKVKITIVATGSEVPLAIDVATRLKNAQVVSMPSVGLFRAQSDSYKKKVLNGYIVVIEAGSSLPWFEFADAVMGIDEFGIGGPGGDVYQHFGFDADKIAAQIKKNVK